jgi:hypothetical protein
MHTMKRSTILALLLAATPLAPVNAQPSVDSSAAPLESELLPAAEAEGEELRGVMILRISERYLEELFARDIDKHTPVTRTVLGTRARGTAHTVGRADVDTKPDKDDAAFYVRITGTSNSRTSGRNGPAIIHSKSVTTWTTQKVIRFDGKEFATTPATIVSNTRLQPLGADSTLPRLRGRIVSRIAARRAIEYNSAAERIVARDAEQRVLADVNRVVDQQIAKLNERVQSQPLMALLLPKLSDAGVQFSTSSNCINISFAGGDASPLAKACPVTGVDPSDTELWFQTALLADPNGKIPGLIDDASAWLTSQLPDIGIPGIDLLGGVGFLPMDIQVIDGWVLLRSPEAGIVNAQARREVPHQELPPLSP